MTKIMEPRKYRPRGRPPKPKAATDRRSLYQTVSVDKEIVRAVRHFLMKKEMETGERFNLAHFVAEACREKLLRERAEDL